MFLIFWECYPLKVKKPKAEAAFLKLKLDRALLDRMLHAIDRQKQTTAWRKNNGQFIPHPAIWLNNRQWEDEVAPAQGAGSVWMEGYVYLSRREEQKAREFFGHHGQQIPDMDEGDSLGGKPVICGLDEHRITGRLVIPRPMTIRQLRDIAIQSAGLTEREWRIWELHCRGNSQGRIASKLGINKSNVCRCLSTIESKITTARERSQKALRGNVGFNLRR